VARPKAEEAREAARAALVALGLVHAGSRGDPGGGERQASRHIMLSYQWDVQPVCRFLAGHG
jgi:hypothetical protein